MQGSLVLGRFPQLRRNRNPPEKEFVMVDMDPAELIDSRPNDGPLAMWRNKVVLGVHHDGAGAMPTEWKIVTDRLVHDSLFGLIEPHNDDHGHRVSA
jgi:hypothetical protein